MSDENEVIIEEETQETPKVVTPEEGLEDLKARLQAAEQRAEAERNARVAAEQQRDGVVVDSHETKVALVANAIDTVRQSNEIAKANYKAAMANGDYEAAGQYQEEIATHAAKLLQLENGKAALEAAPPRPQPSRPADPVEALAQQLTPRSADWVRKHPQFATDQRLFQKMIAAHNLAVADGHAADSDEYFAAVEETLKLRQAATQQEEPRRNAAPPAAPVSRETRSNVVRLTPEQREMAAMMQMTPEEYAKNMMALKKEGRLH